MFAQFLRRLSTPGAIPSRAVVWVCLLGMGAIFATDWATDTSIRLYVLYIFPLAGIVLHGSKPYQTLLGFLLSLFFQGITINTFDVPQISKTTDFLVALAASLLAIFLARATRENYLSTVELASTDPLTGLLNRRSFDAIIALEVARHHRYGGEYSLAMIDLDHFKQLNDSRGHHSGDEALRLVAGVLRTKTRDSDSVARLGGDEFVILMPNTGEADCRRLCETLLASIALRMQEADFRVTASIGCASFKNTQISVHEALKLSDQAMYVAKTQGKGCVVAHQY